MSEQAAGNGLADERDGIFMLYDRDIREPLFDFLENEFGRVRIIEEKKTGKSRADVVMVTESDLYGIEIKSDADTYARLAGQVKDYDRYYDRNMVVAGTRHAEFICDHVPDYWGVVTVDEEDGRPDFYILRRSLPNPKVSWKRKLALMWRPELAKLQEWNGMPRYRDKSKAFVIGKIADRVPEKINEEDLKRQVSEILFERDYTTVEEEIGRYRRQRRR